MKRDVWRLVMSFIVVMVFSTSMKAQDKVEVGVGADLVSGYIWRGQNLGGVGIQPSASVAWKGLSLTAWGAVGFDNDDAKEFDLTLGYSVGGFSVSVTDYSFNKGDNFKTGNAIDGKYFHYGANSTLHVFEAQVGYDFRFLALNWYTNIGGNDGLKKNGKRAYSSYLTLSAPFKLGGLDWEATVGATPWETSFYNGGVGGFAVSEVALQATKVIRVTDSFSLPLFAKVIWNPATEDGYFTMGLSL